MQALRVAFGPGEWSVNRCMRPLIAGLCAYEAIAIVYGNVVVDGVERLPTITALSHVARNEAWGRVVVWGSLGWLAFHILVEGKAAERTLAGKFLRGAGRRMLPKLSVSSD